MSSSTNWARLPRRSHPPREIWLSAQTSQVISIIDATSNGRSTLGGIPISQAVAQGFGLTYLNGSVWVSGEGDQVIPISPKTHLTGPPIQLHGGINLLAAGEGYVWASAHDEQRVFGIDPDTRDIAVKGKIGSGSNGIAVGFGSVWVANYSSGTVSRIDQEPAPVTRSWSASRRRQVAEDISLQGVHRRSPSVSEACGSRTRSMAWSTVSIRTRR